MGESLTVKEVAEALGVSSGKVREWIHQENAPARKESNRWQFDEDELYEWLISAGKAEDPAAPKQHDPRSQQPILVSRREVANRMGTSTRVVANWLEMPGFPGRSGKSGGGPKSKGFFPLWDIARWVYHHPNLRHEVPEDLLPYVGTGTANSGNEGRNRLISARAERAEIELANLQGKLIDAEEVARFFGRTNAYAATVLKGLPDQIVANLPSELSDQLKNRIYQQCLACVNHALDLISELVEGDPDEQEAKRRSR